jgi:hypothetical protein
MVNDVGPSSRIMKNEERSAFRIELLTISEGLLTHPTARDISELKIAYIHYFLINKY